jgi:hypothetical protein
MTPYRIAVETGIPHSSLKYMVDEKFEWKLNHLLSIIDFLNRYGAKISLKDLLDFSEKKTLSQIMDTSKADFREALFKFKIRDYKRLYGKNGILKKSEEKDKKPLDVKKETEYLVREIIDVIKETRSFKENKISLNLKINGKDIDFKKNINFAKGKQIKG